MTIKASEQEAKMLKEIDSFLEANPVIANEYKRRLARGLRTAESLARISYYFDNCTNSGQWSDIFFDVRMFGL